MPTFQILALDPTPFAPLFEASDAELSDLDARRAVVDAVPGFPCRVSLEDAPLGETVLLLTHVHHDVDGAYRASGPIYVRRDVARAAFAPGEVPRMLRHRLLSLRAYDAQGEMRDATVAPGDDLETVLGILMADVRIRYVDIHNAKPGCFNCRAVRAD